MLTEARFLYHFLKFSRHPTDTAQVFKFIDTMRAGLTSAQRDRLGRLFLQDEAFRSLYESGRNDLLDEPYDLQRLSRLPKGCLGERYAELMLRAGLDPEYFLSIPVDDATAYYTMRLRKTHDIWHVLTGFGTDLASELGLQAFYLGQTPSPSPLSVLASGLLNVIRSRDPALIRDTMEKIVFGYQAGKQAQHLSGVVWEDLWEEPLERLRARFNIAARAPTGAA
jgi:ubiquinone biosynthesis protein Coq4